MVPPLQSSSCTPALLMTPREQDVPFAQAFMPRTTNEVLDVLSGFVVVGVTVIWSMSCVNATSKSFDPLLEFAFAASP